MSSGAKKEKSFNGTSKSKFSPNAAVPEKKAEVKLRRKESEKVKAPSDSNRKSVLGRFFHNLVDSDDSKKKAAAADAKKKKGRDAVGGSDLDLPEHGIMLRNPQTLPRDQQLAASPRTRAMTLANQGRDNRNRWSSYDIQACNYNAEGMLPPTVPETDYSTMGHRSQSEETLNALLSADSRPPLHKVRDSLVTHSDSARQPDTMRKHAQLLQSIQETKGSRLGRSDKTIDARLGHGSNGYLLTTEMVIDGQKKDAGGIAGTNPDQRRLSDLQKTSSADSTDGGGRELRPQNQTTASSSDALVLLDEKNRQIDKALADKRKVLSQLFGVAEEDLNHLLEKDVDLSSDVSVRKMILISLLQSDQLTSAISSLLVPLNSASSPDGAGDKGATATGDQCSKEKASSQSHVLHKVASRLHGHLTLLQQIVDRDVLETDRLKKDLEAAKLQIKMRSMPAETKLDPLPELSVNSDQVAQQSADLNVSAEAHGGSIESLSKAADNEPEITSKQDTETTVNIDRNVAEEEKEKAEEKVLNITEHVKEVITEHVMEVELFSTENDHSKTDIHPSSDQKNSSDVDKCIETVDAKVHATSEVIVLNAKDSASHQQESVPSLEIWGCVLTSSSTDDVVVPAEVKEDYQTDLQDNLERLVDDVGDPYHSDNGNRKFMNLESIPEDDDRLSCCDVELRVCASENLYQEILVRCNTEVTVDDDDDVVETTFSAEGETKSDVPRMIDFEENEQSNIGEVCLPSADDDIPSAVADNEQVSASDSQFDLVNSLSNLRDDFLAVVDDTVSNVRDAVLSCISDDTPLLAKDDTPSIVADDARSDMQKDTRSDTQKDTRSDAQNDTRSDTQKDTRSDTEIDDPRVRLDEIEASAADGENSCQVPAITADVNSGSGNELQNHREQESTSVVEKFPQSLVSTPENLESQEERPKVETEQESLEADTDAETSMQLERNSSTESETDGESEEEEEDGCSEADVLKMLDQALLESDMKKEEETSSNLDAEERLEVDLESSAIKQIPDDGSDVVASDQLKEVAEISLSDIVLEEKEATKTNEPKAVDGDLLHNHVDLKENVEMNEGLAQENAKSEISEVVNELLDLSVRDATIAIVSSGSE